MRTAPDPRTLSTEATANGAGDKRETGRKRRFLIPLGIVAALIALIFGIRYAVYAANHVSTDDAQIAGDITTVAPRVKGQVAAVYVHENQEVRKGDRLVVLDDRDFAAALEQAQAAFAQAQSNEQAASVGVPMQSALTDAQTAQASSGVVQAQNSVAIAGWKINTASAALRAANERVAVARAQAAAADAALMKAAKDRERATSLIAAGAISHQQHDATEAAYWSALANDQAAKEGVNVALAGVQQAGNDLAQSRAGQTQAQAQVSASQALLAQAQTGTQATAIKQAQAVTSSAQVRAAQAALELAKLQLSYTVITAPVDGIVSKKSVAVGDNVASGQPLMAIASQSKLWVTANLKETQLDKVRTGQKVELRVDAFPHQTFAGTVDSISPATGATFALIPPDNASGNFTKVVQRIPLRILIDPSSDPQHLLRQGLSVEVSIDTSHPR